MDSAEIFIAFGAVMLVIALLGVAIDWFGKPLRHRKFVAKIYRFPDERQPRRSKVRETPWSDTAFVLPVVEPPQPELLVRYPDQQANPQLVAERPALEAQTRDVGPPTIQVAPADVDALGLVDAPAPDTPSPIVTVEECEAARASEEVQPKPSGWQPGDYVFGPTVAGNAPSATTVRTRYWRNVAAAGGAAIFGDTNLSRLTDGKPPQRTNPRTGKIETMRLPDATNADGSGHTPIPEWPTSEIDPFAS